MTAVLWTLGLWAVVALVAVWGLSVRSRGWPADQTDHMNGQTGDAYEGLPSRRRR